MFSLISEGDVDVVDLNVGDGLGEEGLEAGT
jgi:hypothetical protein